MKKTEHYMWHVWARRKTVWPWKRWDFFYCGPQDGAEKAYRQRREAKYGFGLIYDRVGVWTVPFNAPPLRSMTARRESIPPARRRIRVSSATRPRWPSA